MSQRESPLAWSESRSVSGSLAHRVLPSEISRWLGYPRSRRLEGRVLERVDQSRKWYSEHGRPFFALRSVAIESVRGNEIRLRAGSEPRATLTSESLAKRCSDSEACALVCVALCAGEELDVEVEKRWASDRPDEAYVLDRLGVAVIETLKLEVTTKIGQQAKSKGLVIHSAIGPGHDAWPLADQTRLFDLFDLFEVPGGAAVPGPLELPGPFEVLASGALRPKLSMLLAYPVSTATERIPDVGIPCALCNYENCKYRRSPFAGKRDFSVEDLGRQAL